MLDINVYFVQHSVTDVFVLLQYVLQLFTFQQNWFTLCFMGEYWNMLN